MNTSKVNPFFNTTMTNVFQDLLNGISEAANNTVISSRPAANISEQEDKYVISLAAPGLKKSDFNLQVHKNLLEVSVNKEVETEEQHATSSDVKWSKKEFNYQSFKRTFHLSDSISIDDIVAEYQDGILQIQLPKKEEAKAKPVKLVEIK